MRFFRYLSSLSYEEAQRLCNVDFEKDVAFVAVIGPRDNEEIVGTGAYFLNPSTNLAEIAYMIVVLTAVEASYVNGAVIPVDGGLTVANN